MISHRNLHPKELRLLLLLQSKYVGHEFLSSYKDNYWHSKAKIMKYTVWCKAHVEVICTPVFTERQKRRDGRALWQRFCVDGAAAFRKGRPWWRSQGAKTTQKVKSSHYAEDTSWNTEKCPVHKIAEKWGGAQMVKNLQCRRLGSEGSGNPLQYSPPKNPMDRETCWATVHGVRKSWTRLSG